MGGIVSSEAVAHGAEVASRMVVTAAAVSSSSMCKCDKAARKARSVGCGDPAAAVSDGKAVRDLARPEGGYAH
jgi:hypothetical protein